jgi:hypothetical protein
MTEIADSSVLTQIRDATDEEVDFYTEHGWVMLRGLFSRELAGELLRASMQVVEEYEGYPRFKQRRPLANAGYEPFRQVAWSAEIGRVAHRLINRSRLTDTPAPTRYLDDLAWLKEPGCGSSDYHQDSVTQGADRVGRLNFWVALDEVTPEMGAMRFLDGSHREGPLGFTEPDPAAGSDARSENVLSAYPKLVDLYPLTDPFHYQAGDATVHNGWLIHGSPANETDRERWCYILEYAPADTRYEKGIYGVYDPVDIQTRLGTTLRDDATYPVVYPAA